MPTQQHLTRTAAVHIHDRRSPCPGGIAGRLEELPVRFHAVGGAERDQLGRDELRGRKIRGQPIGADRSHVSAGYRNDCRDRRALRRGSEERNGLPVGGDDRTPFDTRSAR